MSGDGYSNFLGRDNVLVNTDLEGYEAYLRGRELRKQQAAKLNQINTINDELNNLKSRFDRIEDLLLQVLDKK